MVLSVGTMVLIMATTTSTGDSDDGDGDTKDDKKNKKTLRGRICAFKNYIYYKNYILINGDWFSVNENVI